MDRMQATKTSDDMSKLHRLEALLARLDEVDDEYCSTADALSELLCEPMVLEQAGEEAIDAIAKDMIDKLRASTEEKCRAIAAEIGFVWKRPEPQASDEDDDDDDGEEVCDDGCVEGEPERVRVSA